MKLKKKKLYRINLQKDITVSWKNQKRIYMFDFLKKKSEKKN